MRQLDSQTWAMPGRRSRASSLCWRASLQRFALNIYFDDIFTSILEESALDLAETHFLAAGKRDSARSLAQLLLDWLDGGSDIGRFASRGAIP